MRGYFYERAFVNTKTFYICSLRTSVRILRGLRFHGLVITNERSYMKGLEISGSRLYERTFVYVIVAGVRIRTRVRIYMGFRGACLRTCVRKHVTSLGVGCLRTCVRKHLDWEGQITAPGFTGIVHSSVRTRICTASAVKNACVRLCNTGSEPQNSNQTIAEFIKQTQHSKSHAKQIHNTIKTHGMLQC
jgi:hypothetical protein